MVYVWVKIMNSLIEFEHMNNLLNVYGELLSDTQKSVLKDYYQYNLSITEISINRNISRSAVNDALKKGKDKLLHYESVLKIEENNEKLMQELQHMKEKSNREQIKIIEDIERKIKHGI